MNRDGLGLRPAVRIGSNVEEGFVAEMTAEELSTMQVRKSYTLRADSETDNNRPQMGVLYPKEHIHSRTHCVTAV